MVFVLSLSFCVENTIRNTFWCRWSFARCEVGLKRCKHQVINTQCNDKIEQRPNIIKYLNTNQTRTYSWGYPRLIFEDKIVQKTRNLHKYSACSIRQYWSLIWSIHYHQKYFQVIQCELKSICFSILIWNFNHRNQFSFLGNSLTVVINLKKHVFFFFVIC